MDREGNDTLKKPKLNFIQLFCIGKKVWTMSKERKNKSNKRVQILKQRNVALIIFLIQTSWFYVLSQHTHPHSHGTHTGIR